MSSKTITKQGTRSSSNVDQINPSELEAVIKTNRAKNSANQKAKLEEKKRESALSLQAVAWEYMFDSDIFELPDTNFMNCLKQAVTHEQYQQITNDILEAMSNEKEDFCKGNYYTLQEAKNQLYALLTEIMMDEARYVTDQAIEGSKREMSELRKVRSQADKYRSVASAKKANKDKLIKELEVTKKVLTEMLQEELHN